MDQKKINVNIQGQNGIERVGCTCGTGSWVQ